MFCVPAELQNVPLRNPQMFEKLPRAVWRACRLNTAKVLRKVLEDVVQREVRLSSLQEFDDLFTNRIVHRHHLTLKIEPV